MDDVGSSSDEDYVPSEHRSESEKEEENMDNWDVEEDTQSPQSSEQLRKDEPIVCEDQKETEEEKKRRLDALFDDFIGASSSAVDDSHTKNPTTSAAATKMENEKPKEIVEIQGKISSAEFETVTQIFDFAGEEVRRTSGGLDDAIKILSKKPKMSVLDKTHHDWTTFKTECGIHDELQSHNRGRHGYMEKMAFLDRADLRQFEREREARNAGRAKK